MKLTVISGDRQVRIAVRGSSAKQLRRAEKSARRLLDAAPAAPAPAPPPPFGFSTVSDTQLSDQDG